MLVRSLVALLCAPLAATASRPCRNELAACVNHGAQKFAQNMNEGQYLAALPIEWPQHTPTFPHRPPHKRPDISHKTIFQALKEDQRFSRVFKLVNFTEDISAALNDPASSVTFFAPPDRALRPPKRPHHGRLNSFTDEDELEEFFTDEVARNTNELELFATLEGFVDNTLLLDDSDGDEGDKERKRKIIKKIVSAVLKYNILPGQLHVADLAKNTTFPTSLTLDEGSLDSQPLRLRAEQPKSVHPKLTLNFYASITYPDVQAKNGIIHVVNHPLFPPPTTFQILFGFPGFFSTLTSAIQRTHLTDDIDWHWNRKSKSLEGAPAVTFFAPTNAAFLRLPSKLKFFLFSPLGHKALKKILSLHVVPEYVLYSNWAHNASDELLPGQQRSHWDALEDPYGWAQAGCHDSDTDFLNDLDMNEERFDRRILLEWETPARPEADSYGFMSGDDEPLRVPFLHAPRDSVRSPGPCPGSAIFRKECEGQLPCGVRGGPAHLTHDGTMNRGFRPKPFPKPVYTLNQTLPTLLPNHTLNIHVAQYRSILSHYYATKVFVNGRWVVAPDVPARNGAIHVIKHLIAPTRKPGKHHGRHLERETFGPMDEDLEVDNDWEDWEEWLPQWANED